MDAGGDVRLCRKPVAMNPDIEISVVIPVYRVEAYLHECVESVLAQTFRDFEVVLVDDGSPDSCPAICDGYASRYADPACGPVVRVVHKANAGLGMARNSGMDAARGRYVFFLDSDDILRPDALQRLHDVALHTGAQAVHGRLCRFVRPGEYSSEVYSACETVITGADALRRAALCSFCSYPGDEPYALEGSACCALFDLAFIRDKGIRFKSEREYISEDYIFNYEVALHAQTLVQVPDTLYRYRVNPASLTQSPKPDVMRRTVDYCEAIERMMTRDGFGADAARYAFGYAASRIRAQYKYMFVASGRLADKLGRAREWREYPYFRRMAREFDPSVMSRLHRLNYTMFRSGSFRSLYVMIRLQRIMRRLRGHIGD